MNKVEVNIISKICKAFGIFCLMLSLAYLITNYTSLPAEIATKYTYDGSITGYGSKLTLIMLYALNAVMFVMFEFMRKVPSAWSLPVKITEENKAYVHRVGAMFLDLCQLIMVVIFTYVMYQSSINENLSLYIIVPLLLVVFFALILVVILLKKNA